jgi:transcriptional regulator with XRE-family HTH domain
LLTSDQIRAARALLRWEQTTLAEASRVSLSTIKRLEGQSGLVEANQPTIEAIQRALEGGGVEFTNGDEPGVKLRNPRAVKSSPSKI